MLLCLTFLLTSLGVHSDTSMSRHIFEKTPTFQFVPTMNGLDLNQLKGKWWFYKTIDNFLWASSSTCPALAFYIKYGGITVLEDFILNPQKPTEHSRLRWTLVQNKASREVGNMIATRFCLNLGLVEYSFDIVATDYNNFLYVNVWKPFEYPIAMPSSLRQGGVVFTRKMVLGQQDRDDVENKVSKAIYDNGKIQTFLSTNINNTNCQDVVFPQTV